MKLTNKMTQRILQLLISVLVISFFIMMCTKELAKSQQKQQVNLEQTISILKEAITNYKRLSLKWNPQEYFEEFSPPLSSDQKQEVVLHWILSVEGNYKTHILPGVKLYLELFDNEANSTKDVKALFEAKLAGLQVIISTLNRQIKLSLKTQGEKGFFSEDMQEMLLERDTNCFHRIERNSIYQIYGKISSSFTRNDYHYLTSKFKGILNKEFLKDY